MHVIESKLGFLQFDKLLMQLKAEGRQPVDFLFYSDYNHLPNWKINYKPF